MVREVVPPRLVGLRENYVRVTLILLGAIIVLWAIPEMIAIVF